MRYSQISDPLNVSFRPLVPNLLLTIQIQTNNLLVEPYIDLLPKLCGVSQEIAIRAEFPSRLISVTMSLNACCFGPVLVLLQI